MRYILRQTALTLASFACLYVLIGGLSFLVFPDPSQGGPRDFQAAERTLFMTVPKYVFLGRSALDNSDSKVLIIGASNAAVGFFQRVIQPKLACAKVSNLAMGGANISEVAQIINLVHETQSSPNPAPNTFVIGVWYGMFADSDLRFADPDRNRGDTDLDIEKYRYGFYRRTANGPVAVLPSKWLDVGVMALRPLLLVEKAAREARTGVNLLLTGRRSAQRTETEREVAVMSEQDKKKALEYWQENMGFNSAISETQLSLLKNTIASLLDSGERVVLVDLPIPAWHRDASPYQLGYEQKLQELSGQFKERSNFISMSMSDLDGDLDYSDEVHAKRHLANVWSDRLADVLSSFACHEATAKPHISSRATEPATAASSDH
ncbi:hypothetical protein I3J27_07765 [Bradyrhizobium xenonodulans]|uniref:SGNH/GDSL hydrolase family protein n=1 Tax=Bradyrhizobium xenonodulans TaxID=2736875 RepID=A0ABY7MPI6_9BRAD|nr:hypothetical protein [Bradyrhizobium xenonodulans]WBL80308.1 hypothetical protein I3J27_07765 [Bradyrhizobium xenonodulans]